MKSNDVPPDLLNTKCEGQEEPGAAESKQPEIKHRRKLKQARESESAKRIATDILGTTRTISHQKTARSDEISRVTSTLPKAALNH